MAEASQRAQFTAPGRNMAEEDRIRLTSVGVDIGSSTSHLIFSRLELERQDNRYVTVARTVLHESDILLTPYIDETTIDGDALRRFIDQQYDRAGLGRGPIRGRDGELISVTEGVSPRKPQGPAVEHGHEPGEVEVTP